MHLRASLGMSLKIAAAGNGHSPYAPVCASSEGAPMVVGSPGGSLGELGDSREGAPGGNPSGHLGGGTWGTPEGNPGGNPAGTLGDHRGTQEDTTGEYYILFYTIDA